MDALLDSAIAQGVAAIVIGLFVWVVGKVGDQKGWW